MASDKPGHYTLFSVNDDNLIQLRLQSAQQEPIGLQARYLLSPDAPVRYPP